MPNTDPPHSSELTEHSKGPRRIVLQCLFLAFVFLIVISIHLHETGGMIPQAKRNIEAAGKPSLQRAVAEYPTCWMPAYPASLYVASRVGIPLKIFNILSFCGALFLVYLFIGTYYPQVAPSIPLLFVSLVHGNYYNLYQQTSEAFFLFFGTMSLLLLARFKNHPSWFLACGLGLVTAAAALTRLFALFWIVPVVCAHVTVFNSYRSWRRRIAHGFAYITPIALFVFPWLLYLYIRTGFFSGWDRTAPRRFHPELAHWSNLTDFSTNVKFVFKTVFIDFFSLQRTAYHGVVNRYGITESETYILLTVLALAFFALIGLIQILHKLTRSDLSHLATSIFNTPRSLPAQFAIVYFVAVVAVWTFSNNDPIYTRHLFPSYVFVVLTVFISFTWIRTHVYSRVMLAPWYLMAFLFTVTNLLNIGSRLKIS